MIKCSHQDKIYYYMDQKSDRPGRLESILNIICFCPPHNVAHIHTSGQKSKASMPDIEPRQNTGHTRTIYLKHV